MKKIIIITPTFGSSGTGASIYYKLLSMSLKEKGYELTIVSDKDSSRKTQFKIYRLFPARCLRNKRKVFDMVLYFIQNLTYFFIPIILKKEEPDIVIIHSSFYNTVGIFGLLTRVLMFFFKNINFILDVRDRMLPSSSKKLISKFENTIACSENVYNFLVDIIGESNSIRLIPIIQEQIIKNQLLSKMVLDKYSLIENGYILSVGMVKEDKGTQILLESYVDYIYPGQLNMPLVIVGMLKTNDQNILKLLSSESVIYLGKLDRANVIGLMSSAAVCVNMSINEGMPRSSLEPLAMGMKCILPNSVPEFRNHCADFVCNEKTPKEVAQFITKVIYRKLYPKYPIENHSQYTVLPKYINLLEGFDIN